MDVQPAAPFLKEETTRDQFTEFDKRVRAYAHARNFKSFKDIPGIFGKLTAYLTLRYEEFLAESEMSAEYFANELIASEDAFLAFFGNERLDISTYAVAVLNTLERTTAFFRIISRAIVQRLDTIADRVIKHERNDWTYQQAMRVRKAAANILGTQTSLPVDQSGQPNGN